MNIANVAQTAKSTGCMDDLSLSALGPCAIEPGFLSYSERHTAQGLLVGSGRSKSGHRLQDGVETMQAEDGQTYYFSRSAFEVEHQ